MTKREYDLISDDQADIVILEDSATVILSDSDSVRLDVQPAKEEEALSYLQQLDYIITTVMEEESHLFDEKDQQVFGLYQSLDEQPRELLFRLLMRKDRILRVKKIHYSFISNVDSCVEELISLSFLREIVPSSMNEWLDHLTKQELDFIARQSGMTVSRLNRSQISHQLLDYLNSPQDRIQNDDIYAIVGKLFKVEYHIRDLFMRLSMVYSRDTELPEKPFLESILTNMTVNRRSYPSFKIQRIGIVWPTRSDLLDYIDALKTEARIHHFHDAKKWLEVVRLCESVSPEWENVLSESDQHVSGIPWLQIFTKGWVLTRIMGAGVHAYFRLKRYQDQRELLEKLLGQKIYCCRKRGKWFDELAKICDLYIDQKLARQVCIQALSDSFVVSGCRRSIQKRACKLFKNRIRPVGICFGDEKDIRKIPELEIKATKLTNTLGQKALWQDKDGSSVTVEQLVLRYFQRQGWEGIHAENSIVTTLFVLLFWDILFQDNIPGVFNSEYQTHPLDLKTEYFYQARKEIIDEKIRNVKSQDFAETLREMEQVDDRERIKKTRCIGLSWRIQKQEWKDIATCIGPHKLIHICELLCKTWWIHQGGVPDLCIYKTSTKEFKLVEVKGIGDRLSERQEIWMETLRDFEIQVQVMHVLPK